MFSSRVAADLAANRLARAVEKLRASGGAFIDLTGSNPTQARFDYPADLLEPLADARGLTYSPEPFGEREAREAVASDYARRGLVVDADRIVLTASTSEAYSLLFRVLCDPGVEVLVPRPSYPLFEHLSRLDAVATRSYDLEYHGGWSIDLDSVERALSTRTRALLVVTPNNPTGSFLKSHELDRLARICAGSDIALIADEVFADYELVAEARASRGQVLTVRDALVFSLGGLSKSIGLPQVKLGWIAVGGEHTLVAAALSRLELACDTYLSVSTPVQLAARTLLERGATIRQQIQTRVSANYRCLAARAASAPACEVLSAEGGWYAILRVPSFCSEEELVMQLLSEVHVLAHPGYFFDFSRESYLVVSLLTPADDFGEGVSRILEYCADSGERS
jgi:alanine-synthesizing transaminase